MSKNRRQFSPEFKTKVVLEVLEGNATINEIASKYNILPKSIQQWKKQFLENASLAFESSVPLRKYKEEIKEKDKKIDELYKVLGKTQIERDWILKKLRSLDLRIRKSLVEFKLKKLSITRQCEILKINRTSLYYTKIRRLVHSIDNSYAVEIMNGIDEIYTSYPYYGYRRMYHAIKQKGYLIGEKGVYRLMQIMNIQGLYPRKKINTSISNKASEKYPYLLKNEDITRPNQVWASDISYIRLKNGFAYLCAIIDLHTRAIISHKLSNTMDDNLVASTIEDALLKYKKPEIFNSDQGSQYTSNKVINLLKKHNISISMDAKGRCFDNIIMERFWRSLKQENVYPKGYETIKEARSGIDNYIKIYNYQRLHSSIGYIPPMELYKKEMEEVA